MLRSGQVVFLGILLLQVVLLGTLQGATSQLVAGLWPECGYVRDFAPGTLGPAESYIHEIVVDMSRAACMQCRQGDSANVVDMGAGTCHAWGN